MLIAVAFAYFVFRVTRLETLPKVFYTSLWAFTLLVKMYSCQCGVRNRNKSL